MFQQLANNPEFKKRVQARFKSYSTDVHIPAGIALANHQKTWDLAAATGADVLSEIIADEMEAHPFLAKQAAKLIGAI